MVEGLLPFSLDPEGEVPVEVGGVTLLKPGGLKQKGVQNVHISLFLLSPVLFRKKYFIFNLNVHC